MAEISLQFTLEGRWIGGYTCTVPEGQSIDGHQVVANIRQDELERALGQYLQLERQGRQGRMPYMPRVECTVKVTL